MTLTIAPGTTVKFKHYRDYRGTGERLGLGVTGGTVKAVGSPDRQIWFTSDAAQPINGDWAGIGCHDTRDSVFRYVIVEYAVLGIGQDESAVEVSHSIVRWNNSEGLYAERSSPVFTHNLLYENGYHEIALEQYNRDAKIAHNVFKGGGQGAIHHEESTSTIEGNFFYNYPGEIITAGAESRVAVKGNTFANIRRELAILHDPTSSITVAGNVFKEGRVSPPRLDFPDSRRTELGYIPGSAMDKYPFVYAAQDRTRQVVKKIGQGQGFGWTLVHAEGYLWRFRIGDACLEFVRMDPATGNWRAWPAGQILNPRGLAWDGKSFWVNDFSLLKIFKFTFTGNGIRILHSFDIPYKDEGGVMGLAADGAHLYLLSRDGSQVRILDQQGKVTGAIAFREPLHHGLVWTGKHFWAIGGCRKGIGRFTKDGRLVGEIYPPAEGTWSIAWDGEYLWTLQRTCENWDDPKVYQIRVLDDSLT